jgi:exportin-7
MLLPTRLTITVYKGIWICLKILRNALQGGFVNYGVFLLYKDPALANALSIVFKLMFSVPLNQVMGVSRKIEEDCFFFLTIFFFVAYPKFTESHFAFLDTLCSDHTSTVATLDHIVFRQILESFKEGLGALDQG